MLREEYVRWLVLVVVVGQAAFYFLFVLNQQCATKLPASNSDISNNLNNTYLNNSRYFKPNKCPHVIVYGLLLHSENGTLNVFKKSFQKLYHPCNYYLVHHDIDPEPTIIYQFIEEMSTIYQNVIILPKAVDVTWAYFSLVEAEFLLMKAAIDFELKFDTFIFCMFVTKCISYLLILNNILYSEFPTLSNSQCRKDNGNTRE